MLSTTVQYYESIEDLPIYNWNKVVETGQLKWLIKKGDKPNKQALRVWDKLQDEYFEEFGIDPVFRKRLALMKEVVNLTDQYIQTRDRFILNLINIAETDLKGMNQQQGIKFYDLLDKVITIKKVFIDPKTYPTKLWFYTLKNLSDGKADQGD